MQKILAIIASIFLSTSVYAQVPTTDSTLNLLLADSAKELKSNSLVLCEAIKNNKNESYLVKFSSTLALIEYKTEQFFASDYGEAKNMTPLIQSLYINSENNDLYTNEVRMYGQIKDVKDLLHVNDFYYWYSIPLYNRYLDENTLNKLQIERKVSLFKQPCNSYLYEGDKLWDPENDFYNYENPTNQRYGYILGRFD